MTQERLVSVYETTDIGRAEVIQAALREAGIACSLENSHQAALPGVIPCRLLVLSADATRVRQFIQQHEPVHN